MIREIEKKEFLRLAKSLSMKEDMKRLSALGHNPVIIDGKADMDRWIAFLTQFNEFINHRPKPFRPIIDRVMKL